MKKKLFTIIVPLLLITTLVVVESDLPAIIAAQYGDCTVSSSGASSNLIANNETGSGSSVAGTVTSGWGYMGSGVTVTMGDSKRVSLQNYSGTDTLLDNYAPPLIEVDGKIITNPDFSATADSIYLAGMTEDGSISLDNQTNIDYWNAVAKEAGLTGDLLNDEKFREDLLKYHKTIGEDGTKFTKTVEPTMEIINLDTGQSVTITADDILNGEYNFLLNDPNLKWVANALVEACLGGGTCTMEDVARIYDEEKCTDCPPDPTPSKTEPGGGGFLPSTCSKSYFETKNCEVTRVDTTPEPDYPDCYNGKYTYTSTVYSNGTIACGYVGITTTTVTTVNFPGPPRNTSIVAGDTFRWGEFKSKLSVNTSVTSSCIGTEMDNVQGQIDVENDYQSCLDAKIKENETKLDNAKKIDCHYEECVTYEDGTKECDTYISSECEESKESQIAALENTINSQKAQIVASEATEIGLTDELNRLTKCNAEYTNYKGYSREYHDVIGLSTPVMKLNLGGGEVYTQTANTITSIAKNSGELLISSTGAVRKIAEASKYDGSYVYFTIPVNTKNKTTGTVSIKILNGSAEVKPTYYDSDSKYPADKVVTSSFGSDEKIRYQVLSIIKNGTNARKLYEKFLVRNPNFCKIGGLTLTDADCYIMFKTLVTDNSDASLNGLFNTLTVKYPNFCKDAGYEHHSGNDCKNGIKSFMNAMHGNLFSQSSYKTTFYGIDLDDLLTTTKNVVSNNDLVAPDGNLAGSVMDSGGPVSTNVVSDGGGEFVYECPLDVVNKYICDDDDDDDDDCPPGGINAIYRTISLTNPFPSTTTNKYREMGPNWDETSAKVVIENNRGVSDYSVYTLEPLYTIVLTPSVISEIRKYNDDHEYSDFTLTCDSKGEHCTSSFVRDYLSNINALDSNKSCALNSTSEDSWFNCFKN